MTGGFRPPEVVLLLFAAVFMGFGCVSTSEFDSLRNTVANLQMQSITQKREIDLLRQRTEEQARDVAKLRERFEGVYALRESQTNLLTQTSDFAKELQIMKGRFDENKYFIDKTLKEMAAERDLQQAKISAIEREIQDLKAKIPPEEKRSEEKKVVEPERPKADTETKKTEEEPITNNQRLYDDAQIDFQDKKYPIARQKFERFIKENPEHKLVPNAQFWIAEAYCNEKKYEDAILAYETLIKRHPKHERIRVAMLKQGYAFLELGDKKTGKVILERVIERYPRTVEAEQAERKIAELLSQNKRAPVKKKK